MFPRKQIVYPALLAALIPFLLLFVKASEIKNLHVALTILPLLFLVVFNLRYSVFILVLSLFINYPINVLQLSSLLIYIVILSYFICYHDTDFRDLSNSFTIPITIYLTLILPSFLNNQQPGYSLLFMSSLISSFILVHLIYSSNDKRLIQLFLIWFVVFCALNGITAVYDGLVFKKRAFGFAGIMFVDYLSVGMVITFISMLLSKKKALFITLFAFFVVCTILHQTRGVWIALSGTLLLVMLYFLIRSEEYEISRRKILAFLIFISLMGAGGYFLITEINPRIEQRATALKKNEIIIDQEGYIDNSVVTRALIWHTAYNAFKAHPFIGIGSHSFAFQSKSYSTITPFLYKKYVQGVTPHGTLFAILAEVGVIGLLGFLTLIILSLKHSFNNVRESFKPEDKKISVTLYFILVYITLSMVITDAWLFGSGAILWGLVLGMTALHKKQIQLNEK